MSLHADFAGGPAPALTSHRPSRGDSFSGEILRQALKDAFVKLDPRRLAGNPVILATEIVAALSTISAVALGMNGEPLGFAVQIAFWLWATVVFANFAESVAEGRGKAAADSLRNARVTTRAKLIVDAKMDRIVLAPAHELEPGCVLLVEAGDMIPADGEVIEGVASVNEAAITGSPCR